MQLGHLGFFSSSREYYLDLGRTIVQFHDKGEFFDEALISLAVRVRIPTRAMYFIGLY